MMRADGLHPNDLGHKVGGGPGSGRPKQAARWQIAVACCVCKRAH
jgi:hypothetical protein